MAWNKVNSLYRTFHKLRAFKMGLNNKTNKIGLSQILLSLILYRINVTSLIRTNSVISTNFFELGTPLFGLARVYCTA